MVHGEKDEVVPVVYSKKVLKIFKEAKKKLVIVTVKGNHQIHEVNISDEARNLSRDDLQKNIMNACNDAMTKVNKEIKEKMGGAMNLPSGFKLPF